MSEYQYYEFRAIDRPLTQSEMDELRALSSRARITSTSFVNEYNYGNFRGDPDKLIERYFDAFVYIANWGTRQLMFRLPGGVIDLDAVSRYAVDEFVAVRTAGDQVIIAFTSETEDPEWEEGEGWLDALLPLRDDLEQGDYRALYLGWLGHAALGPLVTEEDEEEIEELEPPVPPGLRELSPALEKLAEFLRIPRDLIEIAAAESPPLRSAARSADLAGWISTLADEDKIGLLVRRAEDNPVQVRAEMLRRFRQETAPPGDSGQAQHGRRTIGELVAAADRLTETGA